MLLGSRSGTVPGVLLSSAPAPTTNAFRLLPSSSCAPSNRVHISSPSSSSSVLSVPFRPKKYSLTYKSTYTVRQPAKESAKTEKRKAKWYQKRLTELPLGAQCLCKNPFQPGTKDTRKTVRKSGYKCSPHAAFAIAFECICRHFSMQTVRLPSCCFQPSRSLLPLLLLRANHFPRPYAPIVSGLVCVL